jgi:hypothetical protein
MPISQIVTNSIASGQTITSPVIAGTPTGVGVLTSGTAVASTSGTSIDFTSIPSWVKRVTVMMDGISQSGTALPLIQLGTVSSIETTGYNAGGGLITGTTGTPYGTYSTAGFVYFINSASAIYSGVTTISLLNSATNTWAATGTATVPNLTYAVYIAGSKSLSSVLTRIRFTTVGSTDTFDAGQINILYE